MDCYLDYCDHSCADCGGELNSYSDECVACEVLLCGNCGAGGNGRGLLCKQCHGDEDRRDQMLFNRKWLPPIIILVALVFACNGPTPPIEPPPPPPDNGCDLKPEDCQYGVDKENCVCRECPVREEDKGCSTPVACREANDYVLLSDADEQRDMLLVYDAIIMGNAVDNVNFAEQHCAPGTDNSIWPYKGMHLPEAKRVQSRAYGLKLVLTGADGRSEYFQRLKEPHRNFGDQGRSMVYRPCLEDWIDRVKKLHQGCREENEDGSCKRFWPASNPQGPIAILDGLKAACKEKAGIADL